MRQQGCRTPKYDRSYAVTNPEGVFASALPEANRAIPVRKRAVCRPTA
jgi:hypothetical protein